MQMDAKSQAVALWLTWSEAELSKIGYRAGLGAGWAARASAGKTKTRATAAGTLPRRPHLRPRPRDATATEAAAKNPRGTVRVVREGLKKRGAVVLSEMTKSARAATARDLAPVTALPRNPADDCALISRYFSLL